jgi:hypothetical protein
MDYLHGKSIKVRFSEPMRDIRIGRMEILRGTMACTLGQPVSGDPPAIEVKPMVPGADPISVPLRVLEPVHPSGIKEQAVIIAGENLGEEVVVVGTGQSLWKLAPYDHPSNPMYMAPREHLVARVRSKLRLM